MSCSGCQDGRWGVGGLSLGLPASLCQGGVVRYSHHGSCLIASTLFLHLTAGNPSGQDRIGFVGRSSSNVFLRDDGNDPFGLHQGEALFRSHEMDELFGCARRLTLGDEVEGLQVGVIVVPR